MRIRAGVHAGIATGAVLQVENKQALCFHQSLRKELIDGNAVDHLQTLLVGGAALGGDGFETGPNAGETRDHVAKIFAGNAHEFDVIEGGASGGENATAEQSNFAEIVAAGQISENHLAAGIAFRSFHEADADKIKTVGSVTPLNNALARSEALELDTLF